MSYRAIIINGVAENIEKDHLWIRYLSSKGYEVEWVNMLDENVDVSEVTLNIKPDLIVGFSLGGLLAIKLGLRYPESDLILVATGARTGTKVKRLVQIVGSRFSFGVYDWVVRLNKNLVTRAYRLISPKPKGIKMEDYEWDMEANIRFYWSVSKEKWRQIIKFAAETDCREVASNIKNRCLIVSGTNDRVMPLCLGEELHGLIQGSEMVVTEGEHFDVVTADNIWRLDRFINKSVYQDKVLKR